MKFNGIALILLAILLITCNHSQKKSTDIFVKLYSAKNLVRQTYTINANIDTVLRGKAGTTISISKGTLVDEKGRIVNGKIEIELKEVFKPADIVLANLTTTSYGKPLQTAGMVYINASAMGKPLQIADNKQIGITITTDSFQNGMQLFQGVQTDNGVNWVNPVPLVKAKAQEKKLRKEEVWKRINVKVIEWSGNIPKDISDRIKAVVWQGNGLIISRDTIIKIDSFSFTLVKNNNILEFNKQGMPMNQKLVKGNNYFAVDQNTNYIFSIKKLGWANIDRLLEDPRTQEVEMITKIVNHSEFEAIYITMVTDKMFLPGYQMKNNTFGFSHNDTEKPRLPVGASATIMATAYKNDKPYFSMQKVTITNKQTVTLNLKETTAGELKKELEQKL